MLMLGSVAFAQSAGASAAGAAAPLTLEEGLALAKARACLGCHQVDNKRVGPSFNAIAQRHADKNDAVPYIVQVIQKGGRGQWGAVPMPGQSVNHQDAEKLAQWILSLRK
jgi:cytochrome c